ncbi:MAG: hypothetical protein Q8Q31_04980 [Nanoarchaeota archaeon]|nr:hypothetical protein [Nanoarchaeota archaeon]
MNLSQLSPGELASLSRSLTGTTLRMHPLLLDEISYTVQYAKTAASLSGEDEGFRATLFRDRYDSSSSLLESDLNAAPLIIERLETWAQELPEGSQTKDFALQHLPHVRDFHQNLLAYQWGTEDAKAKREYGAELSA